MADLNERMLGRLQRLMRARAKLEGNIANAEDHIKAPLWRNRLSEYRESIERIQNSGTERVPTGNPVGVEINAPGGGS